MAHAQTLTEPVSPSYVHRISWGAIFAGVVMAVVTQFMLSLLGAGVGLTAAGPGASAAGFGIGAAVWWSVSALVAMYIGGWFAARMAAVPTVSEGVVHGILTWGVSTILSLYILTSAIGGLIGGTIGMVGPTVGRASQQPEARQGVREQVERQTGVDVDRLVEQAQRDPQGALEQLRRQTREEAAQTRDAVAEARAKAEEAGQKGGIASFFAFLSLGLGCLASAVGGRTGRLQTTTGYASV